LPIDKNMIMMTRIKRDIYSGKKAPSAALAFSAH
jgi:hypothetical protein